MELPKIEDVLPGLIGSVGATFFIKESSKKKVAVMLFLGVSLAYYGSAYAAEKMGMNQGLAGWLLGMFGISVVDSIFKTWQERGLIEMVRGVVSAIRGMPPKE